MEEITCPQRLTQHLHDVGGARPRLQQDRSAGSLVKAGQTVEYRGFPRAVRADKRSNRPPLYLKANVVEGFNPAEVHHQVFHA